MESLFQKEKRLKARKPVYTETYKKGVFIPNKKILCEWIMQEDVIVRVHKGGSLDDGTEFNNVSIEGFKTSSD